MTGPEPIRFDCPACFSPLRVPFESRRSAIKCPHCRKLVQLAWHQLIGPELRERNRRWKEGQAAQRRAFAHRMIAEQEAERRALVVVHQAEAKQAQIRARYAAVMSGQIFDVDMLVEGFKNDWVQVQEETELTPVQISQGVKSASPVAGIGAGWVAGSPWVGLAVGLVTFLASGPIAEEFAHRKFLEWKNKWRRIFANFSEQQFSQFAEALYARYPHVGRSFCPNSQMPLP